MESPLGKKLAAAGYPTLWDYVAKNGFTHLDRLKHDIGFETLTPRGYFDFVDAVARIDNRWAEGFRIIAAHALNTARTSFADETLGENWIIIQPVSFLASEFGQLIPWAQTATRRMREYLRTHRELFDAEFTFDSAWLVELVAESQATDAAPGN